MTRLPIFLGAIAFFAASVSSVNLNSEALEILKEELQNINLPEIFNWTVSSLSTRDDPQAYMNVAELVANYDYKAETHAVKTSDGYIVELHRITGNETHPKAKGKPAVYLMHGLLCSSMDWVITGPGRGLGFILADAGYDVWMGNARGSRYSRKHAEMNIAKSKYWDFSWHEIGKYDLPATIDYILKKTGEEKVAYIGHSQGTTALTVLLSERPEYNKKVSVMSALAPISYCSHMTSPVFKTLARLMPLIDIVFKIIGTNHLDPGTEFFKKFEAILCKDGRITSPICTNVIFMICGYDDELLDKKLLPGILAHVPAGASTKQFTHYSQLVNSGQFRQFDYGWWGNYKKYSSIIPPSYNFENVRVPVALHYSTNDWLSDTRDVEKLHAKLPNSIGTFLVPHAKFNHLDFLWAKGAKTLIYDQILDILAKYHPSTKR